MSSQGLHFKNAGAFRSIFTRDESARYSYCLDYQPERLKKGKLQEYINLYHDAGWEYVSSYGEMWHYFRKEWQEGESPRLYTDRESLVAHYKKIQRVIGLMFCLNLSILLINMTNIFSRFSGSLWGIAIPIMMFYLLLFVLLGYGYFKLGKKIKNL